MINYYEYCVVENEHLYGPGKRVLLFLQGCSIHCEGCVNRHLWDFGKGINATSEEIISFCRDNHVEGITLHGGEPLDQSEGLYPIVKALKTDHFTVILFTGYNKKDLNINQRRIWDMSDIVVCGRFDLKKRNVYLQFRGSTNQRIIRRKGKYKQLFVARESISTIRSKTAKQPQFLQSIPTAISILKVFIRKILQRLAKW